jgi:hypothetical protein
MNTEESCLNCKFYKPFWNNATDKGYCNRYPPNPSGATSYISNTTYVCGEWHEKLIWVSDEK